MTRRAIACVLALSVGSCRPDAEAVPDRGSASAQPPPKLVTSSGPTYEDETSTKPVELLKLQFTSGIKGRDPIDQVDHVRPGERVYVHLTVRNRTGRRRGVHVLFKVNGSRRTELDLPVEESWSWRTWALNTVLATDTKGKLTVEITDDEGNGVADGELPIRA